MKLAGKALAQLGERQGVADTGHHVLALGVDQKVAVFALGAGGRVAGEADPGAGMIVAVAEDHGLDVDRGAEVMRDALPHPVGDGPGAVPRLEHRLDGAPQLIAGLLGKGMTGDDLHHPLVRLTQVGQNVGR